jgi:peptidyl-tRNA hydrolase
VGLKPDGADLADWVLSEMREQDEDIVVALLPELTGAVELWINEGSEVAMNSFNR